MFINGCKKGQSRLEKTTGKISKIHYCFQSKSAAFVSVMWCKEIFDFSDRTTKVLQKFRDTLLKTGCHLRCFIMVCLQQMYEYLHDKGKVKILE